MLLQLKNIKKYFPVKKGFLGKTESFIRAVDDIDLEIHRGENLSIVGESGCGKSTLARIILKLLPADSGSILFEGHDMSKLSRAKLRPFRQGVQMVFQDPYSSLDPRFTLRNILKEAMQLNPADRQGATLELQEKRMQDVLTAVHLQKDMLGRYPHEFSGGERQRIAIARCLVVNPKLLILDEAVSSLDVIIQEQLLKLLIDLQSQFDVTYLFISHNLRVVKKISKHVAVMVQGKIVERGPTPEIFNNPLHAYTKELLSAAIQYKASQSEEPILLDPASRLLDQGHGHYVLTRILPFLAV